MTKFRITELTVIKASMRKYYGCINCNNGSTYWALRSEPTDDSESARLAVLDVFTGHADSWGLRGQLVIPPEPVKQIVRVLTEYRDASQQWCTCITCTLNGEPAGVTRFADTAKQSSESAFTVYDGPISEWEDNV